MPFLLDTSVLLRIRDESSPRREECVALLSLLEADPRGAAIVTQVLIEYWVVATRPRIANGMELTPAEADADLANFLKILPCLAEPPDVLQRWRRLVTTSQTRGRPAHDARLVALMEHHGLTDLVTLNPGDFARFEWVTCHSPAEMARTLSGPAGG